MDGLMLGSSATSPTVSQRLSSKAFFTVVRSLAERMVLQQICRWDLTSQSPQLRRDGQARRFGHHHDAGAIGGDSQRCVAGGLDKCPGCSDAPMRW